MYVFLCYLIHYMLDSQPVFRLPPSVSTAQALEEVDMDGLCFLAVISM